jgi:hypothetical protein
MKLLLLFSCNRDLMLLRSRWRERAGGHLGLDGSQMLRPHDRLRRFSFTFNFPEGTRFYFCAQRTSPPRRRITAVTNANPALATSTAHGYVDNDEVLLLSGWEDATNQIYASTSRTSTRSSCWAWTRPTRASSRLVPASGTAQKVGTWVQIPQVLNIQTSGGDPRFTDVQLLASRNALKIPTGFNATTTVLSLAHDPADANWLTMIGISRALTPVAFKMALGGGGTTYAYGYMAVNESPKMNVNQVNQVDALVRLPRPPDLLLDLISRAQARSPHRPGLLSSLRGGSGGPGTGVFNLPAKEPISCPPSNSAPARSRSPASSSSRTSTAPS